MSKQKLSDFNRRLQATAKAGEAALYNAAKRKRCNVCHGLGEVAYLCLEEGDRVHPCAICFPEAGRPGLQRALSIILNGGK